MLSFTEGYRLHLIRMNGLALHDKYVGALRLLTPDARIEPGIAACLAKLDWIKRSRVQLLSLSAYVSRLLARMQRTRMHMIQANVLSANALEQSMSRVLARRAAPRATARKPRSGWALALAARNVKA